MKPKKHATTERIILSVEIVQGGKDARCSMRVPQTPFEFSACTGEWFENAIREMRNECKLKLNEMESK